MSRPVFVIPFLAFALQVSQAQLVNHGAPASVLSPTPDGVQHGAPASVLSPAPLAPGVHAQQVRPGAGIRARGSMRHFGSSHNHQQQVFVPVPLFYPIYNDGAYPSPADPYVADNQPDPAQTTQSDPAQSGQSQADPKTSGQAGGSEDDLRAAYLQGAHDAMTYQGQGNSRYGEHYLDSRERDQQQQAQQRRPRQEVQPEFSMIPVEDKTPTTIFVFKDGHQLETKNYAIMGGTLFDFSGATLKKIKIDDLDSSATVKANDDRGVQVKLN